MNKITTLRISLTTALVLVGLSTLLALFCLNKYIADSKVIDKLNAEVALLNNIKYTSRDAVARVRGYLIVPDPEFLKGYDAEFSELSHNLTLLKSSFAGDDAKLKQLERFKNIVLDRYHNLDLILIAYRSNDNHSIQILTLRTLGNSRKLNSLTKELEKLNNKSLKQIRASQKLFRTVTIWVSLLSYIFSFTFLYFSIRRYRRSEKEKAAAYLSIKNKNEELFNLNNSLDAKVKDRTKELEDKNSELNLYAEHLKNSFEDLEIKVKFRTLELQKEIKNLQSENAALKAKPGN